MNERDYKIDIMKLFAVLLVLNSHFGEFYKPYDFLSTGGAIGDALFFFCSGYTLFLKGKIDSNFLNWYKRRINRIYPVILAWALISCLCFSNNANAISILLYGGGSFVSCILVYYIIIYFIRNLVVLRPFLTCFLSVTISLIVFLANPQDSLYGWTLPCKSLFFLFMLLGAIVGRLQKKWSYRSYDVIILVVSVFLFYAVQIIASYIGINLLNFISIFPLLFVAFYTWKILLSPSFFNFYESPKGNFFVKAIGGLCLEIYICQMPLISGKFPAFIEPLFPFNIIVALVVILLLAYITRILSNTISQTFKDDKYDWNKVFKYW